MFLRCGSLCVGCCLAWRVGTEDLACFPEPVAVFLCEMVIIIIFFSHLCCLLFCQGEQAPLRSGFALGVCRGLEVGTMEGEVGTWGSLANARCFPGTFHCLHVLCMAWLCPWQAKSGGGCLPRALAGSSPWQLTNLGESIVNMLLVCASA